MVISNSTSNENKSNKEFLINTAELNGEDLKSFLQLSAEIEQRRAQRSLASAEAGATGSLLNAKMTREEVFECSTLDDDHFLKALENQNSYVAPIVQVTDLDFSSIESLMHYFNEDVRTTPTKAFGAGKVAEAIANLKLKAAACCALPKESPSKSSPPKPAIRSHVLKLKQKYEKPTQGTIPSATASEESTKSASKAKKFPMKVKELAERFNAKVAQVMHRNSDERNYGHLHNEYSAELQPSAKPVAVVQPTADCKPAKMPRTKFYISTPVARSDLCATPAPVPKIPINQTITCLVAEEIFRQLSVKDRTLLFNKFIEDMSKPSFECSQHLQETKASDKKRSARGEVINERQLTVKALTQELEAKCKLADADKPMVRSQSERRKKNPSSQLLTTTIKSKEAEDLPLLRAQLAQETPTIEFEDDLVHVSTLTVVLKPSPKRVSKIELPANLTKLSDSHSFMTTVGEPFETAIKRKLLGMCRVPTIAYAHAPPKKVRRIESPPSFQNESLNRQFYIWMKEKIGILFNIITISNTQEPIKITIKDGINDNRHLIGNEVLASEANLTVEQATTESVSEAREPTKPASVSEAAAVTADTTTCRNKEPTSTPVPAPRPSLQSGNGASSGSSSAKESDAEESVSGVSKLPPPENELQKSHEHNPAALSEHQLRVQASLQRLNIPDWFRQYNQNATTHTPDGAVGAHNNITVAGYKPGQFTRKRTQESGRWTGLNSKTTSLSSLGSQRSDRSPLLLSPSAHSHHGGGGHGTTSGVGAGVPHYSAVGSSSITGAAGGGGGGGGAFSRWSTSHLNSTQTSPSVSQRGSFARGAPINSSFISVASGNSGVLRNSYRQPYLGWRSQEKLSQRTPHERLASSLLQQRTSPTQRTPTNGLQQLQPVTPEIQSSIKEVTSAIVHYVNDQTAQQQLHQRSRSASPNSSKCWLESSFVGARPLDSPQTPVIENQNQSAGFSNQRQQQQQQSQQSAPNQQPQQQSRRTAAHSQLVQQTSSNYASYVAVGSGHYQQPQQHQQQQQFSIGIGSIAASTTTNATPIEPQQQPLRMNGLSRIGGGGAPERSLSNASLEDVLASLLGLPTTSHNANLHTHASPSPLPIPVSIPKTKPQSSTTGTNTGTGTESAAAFARSTTDASANEQQRKQINSESSTKIHSKQQQQQQQQQQQLEVNYLDEQQRLRRRSEGDAPAQQQNKQQQTLANAVKSTTANAIGNNNYNSSNQSSGNANSNTNSTQQQSTEPRRVSLGDGTLPNYNDQALRPVVHCTNNKCDIVAATQTAKKLFKSCHNCSHLYCSRECRRAHWEKHRKLCLHSRASNLCRQVLANCKDDPDTQRHLSLLARRGFLSQGRGVVRVLFRAAEAAEGFIRHGFQCMGEATYVRWPELMPAEMGLELYSELLKLSTEYKPDSKMLIYVAICLVSEAPGMGQAPVRWERQLVSRCAKLKLAKSILVELELQQQALQQPLAMVTVPDRTEILILTFNPGLRTSTTNRELILANILDILSRRGVLLRRHYPEVYQRLQSYTEGQTDKFNPVTLHPRDAQSGQSFVCIIMPVQSDSDVIRLPSAADGGNRVTTIDVGSPAAIAKLDDDELLTRTTTATTTTTVTTSSASAKSSAAATTEAATSSTQQTSDKS